MPPARAARSRRRIARSRARRGPCLLSALALAGCGYFNSLYNAQRSFDQARRAERRGDTAAAAEAYAAAIDGASTSYHGYPDGRWADDALLLSGRARFALNDYEGARVALTTLLLERPDSPLAADARAWLGAAEAALHEPLARVRLDSALAGDATAEAAAVAHLWRGRLRLERGDTAGWSDLDAAVGSGTFVAAGAAVVAARFRVAAARDPAGLGDARTMLASAAADPEARRLVRELDEVDALIAHATLAGQPLALFAAAERARDDLGAKALAKRLFLDYADHAPDAPWAAKSLLAAAALESDPSRLATIAARVERRPDNPYAKYVLYGRADPAAWESAERELAHRLATIHETVMRAAGPPDPVPAGQARDTSGRGRR